VTKLSGVFVRFSCAAIESDGHRETSQQTFHYCSSVAELPKNSLRMRKQLPLTTGWQIKTDQDILIPNGCNDGLPFTVQEPQVSYIHPILKQKL
jgi:hypothetical protein